MHEMGLEFGNLLLEVLEPVDAAAIRQYGGVHR